MPKPIHATDYLAEPEGSELRPVTVVFGDEPFLKRLALAEVRARVLAGQDSDFSLTTFSGDKAELKEVFDELSTVALFGGQRLVIVEEADDFVSRNRAALEDYVSRPKRTAVLALDVRTWASNTRLYKAVAESGLQIECRAPAEAALLKWLGGWAKNRHQAALATGAAERLLEIVGPEMGLLDQELAKLSLLAGPGAKITPELVEEAVGGWRAKTAWDMLDAAAFGDAREALVQLDRLLLAGENPIAILGQIAATLRRFAAAARIIEQSEAARRPVSLRQALEQAGVKSWPAAMQKAEGQMRRLGRRRARQLYRWLLDADLALKGTSSSPAKARLVLEQLIVRMSSQLAETKVGAR